MKPLRQILLATLIGIAVAAAQAQSADQVKIDTGVIQGSTQDGITSFKGIPYAAPPIGNLRWRAPQPAPNWTGVRPATQFSSDCMQLPFPSDAAPLGTPPAEDCLYINVWVPAHKAAEKLPVMFWIYGGGFVNGGSSPAPYDGTQFAKGGVVFVSFNYRVGRFGFFAFPALSREQAGKPLNNYAFMDQIAALHWVQRNISAFGGNPGDITTFGESAGGGSVLTLLTSPLTKGLFEKAIVESGGGRDALLGVRYLDKPGSTGLPSAEDVGVAFAKSNGIEGTDAAALAALRALPAEKVVAGLNMASMGKQASTYGGPILDGRIVTETPQQALLAGHYPRIPIMIGANSNDIGFPHWRTLDETWAAFGPGSEKAKAAYDPSNSANQFVSWTIAADMMMIEPARFAAQTVAAAGLPSYEYRFSYVAESKRKEWPGALHATEIPYVFDTVKAVYGDKLAPADEAIAKQANAYWVNFAKNGDPNGSGLPTWPAYSVAGDQLMNFTTEGPVAMADPWKQRLDLIAALVSRPAAASKQNSGRGMVSQTK